LQSIELKEGVRATELAFSPDEDRLLIGLSDGMTDVWQWRRKRKLLEHDGFSDPLMLEFSPDGKYVAEIDASITSGLSLWNTTTGKDVYSVDSEEELSGVWYLSAIFSEDSRFLAFCLGDSSVRVVRLDGVDSKPILQFTTGSVIQSIAFHPGGKLLASTDEDGWVTLWNLESVGSVAEFPDSEMVVSGPEDGRLALLGKSLRVVDRGFKTIAEAQLDTSEASVARFSPSGRLIAVGGHDGRVAVVEMRNPAVASWHETQEVQNKPAPAAEGDEKEDRRKVLDMRFSGDERKLLVVHLRGVIEIDLATWRVTPRLSARLPYQVALSPDGTLLASKDVDGPIRLYSLESFQEILAVPSDAFDTSIAFSPDGKLLAGRPDSQTMRVWDVAGKRVVLDAPVSANTSEVGFDPTSAYLAFSDNDKVQVWDLRTKRRTDIVQRDSEVGALTFHPAEPYLALGYSDKKIRIWKLLAQPQIIAEIPQEEEFRFGSAPLQFTKDGKFLLRPQGSASGPLGNFVSVLPWQREDIIRFACERTIRKKLDPSVWEEYLRGQTYRETCPLP
jgi:WD40 repeat protein